MARTCPQDPLRSGSRRDSRTGAPRVLPRNLPRTCEEVSRLQRRDAVPPMDIGKGRSLRPLRLTRPVHPSGDDELVRSVPELIPERSMASDWVSPTEGNGMDTPRAELHIALIARNDAAAEALEAIYVIRPPYWKGGKVELHVIRADKRSQDNLTIRQALADLGLADSRELEILPYPSGVPNEELA